MSGLAVVLVIALLPRREPAYQSRAATYWLDHWATYRFAAMDESVVAFEAMGNEGIQFLTKTAEQRASSLGRKLSAWSDQFDPPVWLAKHLPNEFISEQRRASAIDILAELGPKARLARPALVRLVESENEDGMFREGAKRALRCVDGRE